MFAQLNPLKIIVNVIDNQIKKPCVSWNLSHFSHLPKLLRLKNVAYLDTKNWL